MGSQSMSLFTAGEAEIVPTQWVCQPKFSNHQKDSFPKVHNFPNVSNNYFGDKAATLSRNVITFLAEELVEFRHWRAEAEVKGSHDRWIDLRRAVSKVLEKDPNAPRGAPS